MTELASITESGKSGENRFAVILAGGDGSRLKSLTRAIAGDERPKQFCPILGTETLLDRTRKRIAMKVASENTYLSLTKKHEEFYRAPLWDVRSEQLIVQPESKGTAPAILYSLLRIAAKAPNATVAFFPSDHYFSNDELFMDQVETAFQAIELVPDSVVLLGIEPEKPETAYGWIQPALSLFDNLPKGISRVEKFWEKPSSKSARMLMSAGCLWNSFVMIGSVDAFLAMFRKHLPGTFRVFNVSKSKFGAPHEASIIRSIYGWLPETNFSSEVLEKATKQLIVMRVGDVGWCDWGEPQRVLGTLTNLGVKPEWAGAFSV